MRGFLWRTTFRRFDLWDFQHETHRVWLDQLMWIRGVFGEQRAHKRQSMKIILKCKDVCKVYIERGNLIRYRCVRHYIANYQTQDTHILTCGMTSWTVMNSATKWLYQLMLSVGQVDRTRYRLLINYQQL